jgi:hypothetical protein
MIGLLFTAQSLQAQDSLYARNVIATLASPAFHGRGYAFKGDSIAADYISKEFGRLNLKSKTSDYFQSYFVSMNVFEQNTRIDFGANYPTTSFSDAMQIAMYSASVKGDFKIVPATDDMLLKTQKTSAFKNKFIAVDMSSDSMDKEVRKEWGRVIRNNLLKAKGYVVLKDKLSPYSPGAGTIKSEHTTVYIVKDSISGNLKKVSVDLDARFIEQYATQNVFGYIEGTRYPDTFFVIGAHYDHLGQAGRDYIFHGANDNAAGVAMMLDLARHYSLPENRPEYSIAFVAFSGEEIGLLGSFYFVDHPLIEMSNIKVMLNLDLVGTGEDGFTFVCGKTFPEEFEKFLFVNEQNGYPQDLVAREAAPNSDHYPFFKKGCKALFIYGMGKSGAYHHPSDTLENLSMGGYTRLVRMIVDYLNLDNSQ